MKNFYYSKPEPKRGVLLKEKGTQSISSIASITKSLHDLPQTYSKQEGERESFLFIIISGGEKREIDYFSAIEKKRKEFKRVRLFTLCSPKGTGGLTPQAMYSFALNSIQRGYFEKEGTLYSYSKQDKIYLVTDVDHFGDELGRIRYLCEYWGLNIIISNPCFEIWLYYSYFNDPWNDLSGITQLPLLQRSSALKNRLGELKPGGIDPRKAFGQIPQGIKNAKIFHKETLSGIPKLFNTHMFILAEDLLNKLGREWEQWRKKDMERIASFRNKL